MGVVALEVLGPLDLAKRFICASESRQFQRVILFGDSSF